LYHVFCGVGISFTKAQDNTSNDGKSVPLNTTLYILSHCAYKLITAQFFHVKLATSALSKYTTSAFSHVRLHHVNTYQVYTYLFSNNAFSSPYTNSCSYDSPSPPFALNFTVYVFVVQ